MNALLITPTHNSPGKFDATGAFLPEARALAARLRAEGHHVTLVSFDNRATKPKRRAEVESFIRQGKWSTVAFLCHGLANSIQSGHDLTTLGSLADALAASTDGTLTLIGALYACDAADTRIVRAPGGDGGFADMLRDALATRGVKGHVDAHVTTGHTTKNPNVRRFSMDGGPGIGGEYLVAPGSPLWSKWVKALKGDLRLRFPWMRVEDIRAELG